MRSRRRRGRTVTPFGAAGNGDDEATNNRHGIDEDVAKSALGAFRRPCRVHSSIALIPVDLRRGRITS